MLSIATKPFEATILHWPWHPIFDTQMKVSREEFKYIVLVRFCNIFSSTTSGNLYGFIMGKLLPEEFSKPTKSIKKINTMSLLHPSTPHCFHGLTLKHTFSVTIPQVCPALLFALLDPD